MNFGYIGATTGFLEISALPLPSIALSPAVLTGLGLVMVLAVVALVAWALQLMQAANDRKEFSLMLAGCMVCSAAVGLATVMVLTLTSPDRLEARGLLPAPEQEAGISLDSIVLPWDGQF
ncbi:hypothetical protein [Cyanobium sp. WAJ14-Wanaka]|uniref:hypothetical protein n=1 Tax=Cyanobium sp. WAJ14-Wanaka TaxID=2823725 RepID=UPI0020CE3678|nr:hypothetical protein [Cyanobium sp. WAJ14-Wanaka]